MPQVARQLAWDDLRFFLAVCRNKTVSAAAQQICVDHATVSRRVARLELLLNAKLFEHDKAGYAPTEAGERLFVMAEGVEASIVECQAEISDRNSELEGCVRVGAPDGFGTYFLAPRLAQFCNAHPKLRINLIATARIFSLAQREIDISISLALPKEGRIFGRKLVDYELGLFASEQYVSSNEVIRSRDDLESHPFIGYIDEMVFSSLLDYVPAISRSIAPRFRSSNLLAQLQAVRDGHGIAVLPRFIASKVDGLVPVLASQVKLQRTFYLLVHEDNKRLARVRAVTDHIYESVHDEIGSFSDAGQRLDARQSIQPSRGLPIDACSGVVSP